MGWIRLLAAAGAVGLAAGATPAAAAVDGTGHGYHAGTVPLSTSQRADGTYELLDGRRGETETRFFPKNPASSLPTRETSEPITSPGNAWGDGKAGNLETTAVDVHYGVGEAWDYFKTVQGRDGVRGDGRGMVTYLYRDTFPGSSFNSTCFCLKIAFGDTIRPATDLQTVGHEFTHAVTASTAKLANGGEPAALDEATSDIFGVLIRFYAQNPADPADYVVPDGSEDVQVPEKPLRYMDDPAKDGKSPSCWSPGLKDLDEHFGSGVGNKFFFTLAVGSGKSAWGDSPTCGSAPAVTGIGNDKAGRIWYRALTTGMVSNTNYSGARQATLRAAADLYGEGSGEQSAVQAAWLAVGVDGSDPIPPVPPVPQDPVVTAPLPPLIQVGTPLRVQVPATDPQDDPLTFTAANLPPGLTISPGGLVSGTPTTAGYYVITVTAADPAGHTGSDRSIWKVEPAAPAQGG